MTKNVIRAIFICCIPLTIFSGCADEPAPDPDPDEMDEGVSRAQYEACLDYIAVHGDETGTGCDP